MTFDDDEGVPLDAPLGLQRREPDICCGPADQNNTFRLTEATAALPSVRATLALFAALSTAPTGATPIQLPTWRAIL